MNIHEASDRTVTAIKSATVRVRWSTAAEVVVNAGRHLHEMLAKANFNPSQPRVSAGQPTGGQWTDTGNIGSRLGGSRISAASPSPTTDGATSRIRQANNRPAPTSSLGSVAGQGRSVTVDANLILAGVAVPPEVPNDRPPVETDRWQVVKEVARWAAIAALEATPEGRIVQALEIAVWLTEEYAPYIQAYLDAPKPLAELQEAAKNPQRGYDLHHIVEQTSARQDGFDDDLIESPDNIVRIPKLRHWELTAWFNSKNDDFGGLSPRNYLRGRDWNERRRVGLLALIKFGILAP